MHFTLGPAPANLCLRQVSGYVSTVSYAQSKPVAAQGGLYLFLSALDEEAGEIHRKLML